MSPRRKSPILTGLLALATIGGAPHVFRDYDSRADELVPKKKHDPERPKTSADLEAIARAEAKRARKALRSPHPSADQGRQEATP